MTNRSFGPLFGTSRESADLVSIAVNATRNGYAVLPVHPGKKIPMCTLTDAARKKADKEASLRAKDAGHKGWMNVRHSNSGECGVKHAITEDAEARKVFNRLFAKHPDLNLALEVGASRMICVDADNEADVVEFTAMWAEACNEPLLRWVQPTVRSPGVQKDHDTWTHKGGGHFWYYLPDDFELPETTAGPLKLGGSVLYFKDRVLLVPPSVREEGPYVYQSDVGVAPQFLLDLLTMHIEGTAERRKIHRDKVKQDGDPIDIWSADTPWAELLDQDGWTQAHKFDSCMCEVWTRPGDDWSSPKSATAHEPGCTQWDTEGGHGFLHIWTDDPPDFIRRMVDATGNRSLSKLQYVAWRDHDGDMSAAMKEIGLASNVELTDPWALLGPGEDTPDARERATDPKDDAARAAAVLESLIGSALPNTAPEPATAIPGAVEPTEEPIGLRARMFTRSRLKTIPPPVWLIKGLLTRDSLARLSGAPGSWKSFAAIDMACCVVTGTPYHGQKVSKGKALYVAAEGVSGINKRIQAWELKHGIDVPEGELIVISGAVAAKTPEEWAELCLINRADVYDLIVLDTQARMTAGWNENDNSEMSIYVARKDLLRQQADSCVMTIHHAGHEGSRGRGASSMWGAMDAELFLSRDKEKGTGTLSILKAKESTDDDTWVFTATEHLLGEDEEGEAIKSLTLELSEPQGPTERSIDWWISILDRLGLPNNTGRPTASEALKIAGYTFDDNMLKEVIKKRKARDVPIDLIGGVDGSNGYGSVPEEKGKRPPGTPDDEDGEGIEGVA